MPLCHILALLIQMKLDNIVGFPKMAETILDEYLEIAKGEGGFITSFLIGFLLRPVNYNVDYFFRSFPFHIAIPPQFR